MQARRWPLGTIGYQRQKSKLNVGYFVCLQYIGQQMYYTSCLKVLRLRFGWGGQWFCGWARIQCRPECCLFEPQKLRNYFYVKYKILEALLTCFQNCTRHVVMSYMLMLLVEPASKKNEMVNFDSIQAFWNLGSSTSCYKSSLSCLMWLCHVRVFHVWFKFNLQGM